MGPGKDTHGTLGPGKKERPWVAHNNRPKGEVPHAPDSPKHKSPDKHGSKKKTVESYRAAIHRQSCRHLRGRGEVSADDAENRRRCTRKAERRVLVDVQVLPNFRT